MKKVALVNAVVLSAALFSFPQYASAQQPAGDALPANLSVGHTDDQQSNVPAGGQQAQGAVERAVDRFRIGVEGGIGLDPELIMFGAHGSFGPIFSRNVQFRPGIEFGFGEVTTLFGINLDVLYTLPGTAANARWTPYVGAGPNFSLSHRGFETDEGVGDDRNRFDFGDTDFEGGFNFIAGARARSGAFMELKATAYGVSNVRLLVGFNF